MTDYKTDDKVVVEIKEVHHGYVFIKRNGNGNDNMGHAIDNKEVLGKLEDFMPIQEKIKMTAEEKKEFDEVINKSLTPYEILHFLNDDTTPELFARGFGSGKTQRINQFELIRALEHPELIEIVEPKAYAVDINGARLCKIGNKWSFDKGIYVRLTLDEVKEAEKELGIQGLQAKWHEAAKEDGE